MKEHYELPILFTEEQNKAFAENSLKTDKLGYVFLAIVAICFITAAVQMFSTVLYMLLHGEVFWIVQILEDGWVFGAIYKVGIFLSLVIIAPLEFIRHKLSNEPVFRTHFRVELDGDEVIISQLLNDGKPADSWPDRYKLYEYAKYLDPKDNTILFHGRWTTVGANTKETIYPIELQQRSSLPVPNSKPSDIVSVQRLVDILKGYLDSMEAQRKQMEWAAENGMIRKK